MCGAGKSAYRYISIGTYVGNKKVQYRNAKIQSGCSDLESEASLQVSLKPICINKILEFFFFFLRLGGEKHQMPKHLSILTLMNTVYSDYHCKTFKNYCK